MIVPDGGALASPVRLDARRPGHAVLGAGQRRSSYHEDDPAGHRVGHRAHAARSCLGATAQAHNHAGQLWRRRCLSRILCHECAGGLCRQPVAGWPQVEILFAPVGLAPRNRRQPRRDQRYHGRQCRRGPHARDFARSGRCALRRRLRSACRCCRGRHARQSERDRNPADERGRENAGPWPALYLEPGLFFLSGGRHDPCCPSLAGSSCRPSSAGAQPERRASLAIPGH